MKLSLSVQTFVLLALAFMIYSSTGVFSKQASFHEFLSQGYILNFGMVVITMGLYAVIWQFILGKIPLSQAYLFKSLTVVFSLLFAYILFGEYITLKNVIGSLVIIVGIVINSISKTE